MKIGPFFKWFGSKWQSAHRYPKPLANIIIEPFAGSAGYSCNYPEHQIYLWEDDPQLKKLWTWLINVATSNEILEIPLDIPQNTDITTLGLSEGQALLLKHWQRTNNVGNCWTISPWGNLPGQWTNNTRSRIAEEIYCIKHWNITAPIDLIDTRYATWFIDPPYQFNYQYNPELEPFDYSALDRFIQTIANSSRVIVCEAIGKNGEIPNYLPFVQSHYSVTSRRKPSQSHHSKELIYVRHEN